MLGGHSKIKLGLDILISIIASLDSIMMPFFFSFEQS